MASTTRAKMPEAREEQSFFNKRKYKVEEDMLTELQKKAAQVVVLP